mmetsp:Transcript_149501/g.260840  ORF Transcript_149501/g.260840 Transcript_149501/m.260840 type:complete len:210 (-) Transcript_149501:127-756(-)
MGSSPDCGSVSSAMNCCALAPAAPYLACTCLGRFPFLISCDSICAESSCSQIIRMFRSSSNCPFSMWLRRRATCRWPLKMSFRSSTMSATDGVFSERSRITISRKSAKVMEGPSSSSSSAFVSSFPSTSSSSNSLCFATASLSSSIPPFTLDTFWVLVPEDMLSMSSPSKRWSDSDTRFGTSTPNSSRAWTACGMCTSWSNSFFEIVPF